MRRIFIFIQFGKFIVFTGAEIRAQLWLKLCNYLFFFFLLEEGTLEELFCSNKVQWYRRVNAGFSIFEDQGFKLWSQPWCLYSFCVFMENSYFQQDRNSFASVIFTQILAEFSVKLRHVHACFLFTFCKGLYNQMLLQ